MCRKTILSAILVGSLPLVAGTEPTTKAREFLEQAASVSDDPNDWPMYNRDQIGTRYNRGEKALGKENVGQLVERWRFPSADSKEKIGVVHATVVGNVHQPA